MAVHAGDHVLEAEHLAFGQHADLQVDVLGRLELRVGLHQLGVDLAHALLLELVIGGRGQVVQAERLRRALRVVARLQALQIGVERVLIELDLLEHLARARLDQVEPVVAPAVLADHLALAIVDGGEDALVVLDEIERKVKLAEYGAAFAYEGDLLLALRERIVDQVEVVLLEREQAELLVGVDHGRRSLRVVQYGVLAERLTALDALEGRAHQFALVRIGHLYDERRARHDQIVLLGAMALANDDLVRLDLLIERVAHYALLYGRRIVVELGHNEVERGEQVLDDVLGALVLGQAEHVDGLAGEHALLGLLVHALVEEVAVVVVMMMMVVSPVCVFGGGVVVAMGGRAVVGAVARLATVARHGRRGRVQAGRGDVGKRATDVDDEASEAFEAALDAHGCRGHYRRCRWRHRAQLVVLFVATRVFVVDVRLGLLRRRERRRLLELLEALLETRHARHRVRVDRVHGQLGVAAVPDVSQRDVRQLFELEARGVRQSGQNVGQIGLERGRRRRVSRR